MRLFHDRSATETTESSVSRHEKRKSLSDGVKLMSKIDLGNNIASNDTINAFHSSDKTSGAASRQLDNTAEINLENTRVLLSEKEERNKPKLEVSPSLFSVSP